MCTYKHFNVDRGQRCSRQDRGAEARDHHDPERGEDAVAADDGHPLRDAAAGSHDQEATVDLLGSGAEVRPRRQDDAGDDTRVRRLQEGEGCSEGDRRLPHECYC